jgi:hypothetical protein
MSDEDEGGYADLAPSITVRLAAGLHAVSGLYLALSAVQVLISARFFGPLAWLQYLNWTLLFVGVGQIYVGAQLVRMREPYGVVAVVLGFVVALLVTGWVVANVSFTVFSCMQIFALLFAWGAALASTLAVGPVKRAAAARKRLEAGGMDLGL